MKDIGIIYCPNHRPFTSPAKRWEEIAECLRVHGIDYDMVQSEHAQSVERLVMMMINNGYKTIVIAGGDSALNDAVNCLMKVEKHVRESIALAVIPNGTVNDFAAYWGFYYKEIETSIIALKHHRIRKVDAGCLRYTNRENQNCQRYFLNCVNVGLLARTQKLRRQMRRRLWSRKVSFAASMVLMLLRKTEHKMTYTLDSITESHRVTTLCAGSARGYGQTPNATPYNGMLDITVVRRNAWTQLLEAMLLYIRGEILNHNKLKVFRTRSIEIEAPKGIPVTVDGRPEESPVGAFRISILPEEINFIIEKG